MHLGFIASKILRTATVVAVAEDGLVDGLRALLGKAALRYSQINIVEQLNLDDR